MKLYNPDEIRKWHSVFKKEGDVFEIRLLGDRTFSAYFTDVENAIKALEPYDRQERFQIYFTVNEVNPACSSRKQYNQFLISKNSSTSKNDISHRWWLPIDIDVKRPSDISSTNEEKEYAHRKAADVFTFMADNGFPNPVVCDSSSGYHIYYPIDLDNTTETEKLVYSVFDVLSSRFTDDMVKIDRQVGDANRIMRLPGSWGRKGRDSEERPHRMARILLAKEITFRADANFLTAFVEKYKVVETKPENPQYNGGNSEPFDIRRFMADHGLTVRNETAYGNGGVKYVLDECPFDSSHKAPDSAIFVTAQGAIGFKCFHDSCSCHDWHELRQKFEPDAYNRPQNTQRQQQPTYRNYRPQVAPPPIKQETQEIGKKWLSLSDIVDENLDALPRIKTYFREIDNIMGGGLFYGETTIVSGINGSGKSSWLNSLILNAVDQGAPTALWTGELRAPRLKRWIIQAAAGPCHVEESKLSQGKYYTPKKFVEPIEKWMDGKFYLYNNDYSSNYAQIFNDMSEILERGIKLFILDNLFAMDLDGLEGDENGRQKNFILKMVDFAKKNNVHVILVAHPRKVVTFLRKEDILGSSALQNGVDNIFIIHRNGNDFVKRAGEFFDKSVIEALRPYGNIIEICKNREFGALEKLIGMNYDVMSRRFTDIGCEKYKYGWEADAREEVLNFPQQTGYLSPSAPIMWDEMTLSTPPPGDVPF